ncbi:family 20 glycosylhydrolase [Amycolatopsis nivea]
MSRRFSSGALAATVLTALLVPVPAAAAAVAAAPAVLPPLRAWTPADGAFELTEGSHIVVADSSLLADAHTFADDLAGLGVRSLPVATGTSPRSGDLFLTTAGASGEGYRLDVARTLTIAGDSVAGVAHGEQSVEQILAAVPDHATVPAGSGQDGPARQERGLMIDTARKYWSVDSIKQLVRRLAWLKLNTLHWHVTDSESFRLDLPGYPGLAARQSYSPGDVRDIQDYAARYHVTVLPELDIPGHATSLTAYRPSLRWDCASMNSVINPGRADPGFTVDITKPDAVAWLDGLVGAVAGEFDSPVIHLGGDETPSAASQAQCPELTGYAAARGYAKPEDVFLAYENHLDAVLAARGKRMEVWGWWPQAGGSGSVTLNKDVRVQAWLGDEAAFLAQGYDVVVSNEHSRLYVVPKYAPGTANGNYIPDDDALYRSYAVPDSPRVRGVEMAEWGDNAFLMPDGYPLSYLRRPLQILASTAWGSPRMAGYLDYEQLADRVGDPPGAPAAIDREARVARGVPTAGVAAFDGDPATAFVAPAPGATIGLDLGAPARPAAVNLLPRSTSSADLASLVGTSVTGCTDRECHPLGTVRWTPTRDWLTLPVDDQRPVRWVRFTAAPSATLVLAEAQVLTVPGQVTVAAPARLSAGPNLVRVTVANPSGRALPRLRVDLAASHALDNTLLAASPAQFVTVPPRGSATVAFVVTPGRNASTGDYRLLATAGGHTGAAPASLPPRELKDLYDNAAVTDDANPQPGDLDGAQSSFSAQGLAAAGVRPGGSLTADGFAFRSPETLVGVDNAIAHGQVVPLHGKTSRVGFLATGSYAPGTGTAVLSYADGHQASVPVTVPDWTAAAVPEGVSVAADGGAVNGYGRAQAKSAARLYAVSVPADPRRELVSVTLPDGPRYLGAKTPAIHVFAIATH